MAEYLEFPEEIEYRALTEDEQEIYDKFLRDKAKEKDRARLFFQSLIELEEVRIRLAEAEQKAFQLWEAQNKGKSDGRIKERVVALSGKVYGTEMKSSNLGVVLDNSGSMRDHIDAVRAEIQKSFPDAHFREAAGSGLSVDGFWTLVPPDGEMGEHVSADDSWFYGVLPPDVNPFDPKWHEPQIYREEPHLRHNSLIRNELAALMALIQLHKVDTLYWFSNCQDDISLDAVRILWAALEANGVKFYLHSSDRRPDKNLAKLVELSGGEIIRKRIR